jgi:hypothetical protein
MFAEETVTRLSFLAKLILIRLAIGCAHSTDGDCPFLVLSRTTKGQRLSLPIRGTGFYRQSRTGRRCRDHLHAEAKFNVT